MSTQAKVQRSGWFRVRSSGAVVRATQTGDRVRLHDGTANDYDASAFEWMP